jgi:hypothetical protein
VIAIMHRPIALTLRFDDADILACLLPRRVRHQRLAPEMLRLDLQLSVGPVVHHRGWDVREQLLARLREQQRLLGRVRRVVQPQVHRYFIVHDDGRAERQRRLLGRSDLSHHVHRQLLGRLRRRLDVHAGVPWWLVDVDRRCR